MLKSYKFLSPHQHLILPICNIVTSSHRVSGQRTFMQLGNLTNKRREYVKKELIGYSAEEMYTLVADVKNYYKFVPYVKKSFVHDQKGNIFKADLIVGFPPLNEQYTSSVELQAGKCVRAECFDGRVFNYLLNEWHFSAGLKDIPQSCVMDFHVAFEFKSLLHSNIANLFFEFICDQMENAFITEAGRRYGPSSIKSHVLSSKRS